MSLANRPISISAFSRRSLLASAAAVVLAACGGSTRGPPKTPLDELPPYTEDEQGVFDDSLAPEVFGLHVERGPLMEEPLFVERVQFADHIFRAKLQTVKTERVDDHHRYHIVVQPVGKPLAGHRLRGPLELTVGRASPSSNLLRSMATNAVGRTTIIFLREYRLKDERVLHFRSEPDSEAVEAAVLGVRKAGNRPTND